MTYQLLTDRSAEMYLVTIACLAFFVSIASANPFHKFPYVFLLDVGNEELEKTNTEQIRVSVPGGSIALRYPALGDGDTITHVRVSGIDFGTDLKTNIVDGGPGYKYVIIVFAGNQDTPYDAVLTIQTVSDEDMNNDQNNADVSNNINSVEDSNDSAEDTSDYTTDPKAKNQNELDSQIAGNTNTEIRQSSKYAYRVDDSEKDNNEDVNEEISKQGHSANSYRIGSTDADYENTNEEENASNEDIYIQNSRVNQKIPTNDEQDDNQDSEDSDEDSDETDRGIESNLIDAERSDFSDDYNNEDTDKAENTDDVSKYTQYQPLIPKLYGGLKIYPQNAVPLVKSDNDNLVHNSEDPNEVDQTFNHEELYNTIKNKDSNKKKYIDSDDTFAVES